jgi:hypothetical protein
MRTQSLCKDTDDTKKEIHSKTETTQRKFQMQLKEAETQAGCGSHRTADTSIGATQPPKLDELTSWAMFQQQFKRVAEHSDWTLCDKATYQTTALNEPAAHTLNDIPIGATY